MSLAKSIKIFTENRNTFLRGIKIREYFDDMWTNNSNYTKLHCGNNPPDSCTQAVAVWDVLVNAWLSFSYIFLPKDFNTSMLIESWYNIGNCIKNTDGTNYRFSFWYSVMWYFLCMKWLCWLQYLLCCYCLYMLCKQQGCSSHIILVERRKAPNQKSQNIIFKSTTFTFQWVFNQVGEWKTVWTTTSVVTFRKIPIL